VYHVGVNLQNTSLDFEAASERYEFGFKEWSFTRVLV